MPLDFTQFSSQLDTLVADAADARRHDWLLRAREQFRNIDQPRLHERLSAHRQRRVPWLTAEPDGDLHAYCDPDAVPGEYAVLAADGSNIPPDRHAPVRFYVLNAAWVRLTYGRQPGFATDVETRLCYRPDDLYLDEDRSLPVEGGRLSARMAVAEIEALQRAMTDDAEHMVGLLDGTMILWMIQGDVQRDEVREQLLERYLQALDWFYERRIPIASYISSPGSFELSNMLRAYLSVERGGNGDDTIAQLCRELRDIRDSLLLRQELGAGERTCLFRSQSEILTEYGKHEILYFYMNTGDDVLGEIARVEVPQWVARDEDLMSRLHAALWDQCCRSGEQPPYPPALHEAHEQAVISTGDRQVVEQLLTERLAAADVSFLYSAKAHHKRTRGL